MSSSAVDSTDPDDAVVRRTVADLAPLPTFEQASQRVLHFLHDRLGMGLWMVTRAAGRDWVVLHSRDDAYGVADGDVFDWSGSFCSRMVRGDGPRIAPDSDAVVAYRDAEIRQRLPIGSYVGVPLTTPDGGLFGTLCAIAPGASRPDLVDELALVELQGQLLSSVLAAELQAFRATRRAEAAERSAHSDVLTGLSNRRGWYSVLRSEESRARRHASPCSVLVLDLDGLKQVNDEQGHAAGDALIRTAASLLVGGCRAGDAVARLGGDEFGVLAVEATAQDADRLRQHLQQRFEAAGVPVSIGVGSRLPAAAGAAGDGVHGLDAAWERADGDLYRVKRERRQARGRPLPAQRSC